MTRGAIITENLIKTARRVQRFARANYSKFSVGAALMSEDGRIFTGCNIESSSFGLTICAERCALFKALSEGVDKFKMIAVVTDCAKPQAPCGACRQVLWDYAPDIEIILVGKDETIRRCTLEELFPIPFSGSSLKHPESE